MRQIILYISALILFVSCEKEADIELPNVERKLSVSCFISDDIDTIKAVVFWSRPVFSPAPSVGFDFARDCNVIISNGQTERTLGYNLVTEQYELSTAEFPLEAGGTYTLTVRAENGVVVQGTTKIPSLIPVASSWSVAQEEYTSAFGEQLATRVYRTFLNDLPGDNYYRFVYYDIFSPDVGIVFNNYISESYAEESNAQDGTLYMEHERELYTFNQQDRSIAYVILSGEDYFLYHRTLQNQDPGNPFAEPTLVYSNIRNGLGCFGGYRKTIIEY